jgi:ABC-type multidrug transport system ATPase subunit
LSLSTSSVPTDIFSGCGKTTLLNVLAHRQVSAMSVDKSILVNNQSTSLAELRLISSFVEQEDALIGALTVKETLSFAAKLSLPS